MQCKMLAHFYTPANIILLIELYYKHKKLVAISDTHGHHRELIIPETDFLIHCGDACTDGDEEQLEDFFQWFSEQPERHKIFVAGNHDLTFDLDQESPIDFIPNNVMYLENRYTVIEEISFYSVPARLWLHEIPEEKRKIDFLLTHGPAYSVLDLKLGCRKLLSFVRNQQPGFHLFGHIHETDQRSILRGNTQFFNVSSKEI